MSNALKSWFTRLLFYAVLLLLLGLAGLAGCAGPSLDTVPADMRQEFIELVAEQEAADATPTLEDDQVVEEKWRQFEARYHQRQAKPFADLLPGGLGALVVGLAPLLGKRGRRHYSNAIKSITRGQVLTAAGDVLKAVGAQHSSPESEAAAESKPSAPTS